MLLKWDKERIISLVRVAIRTGQHPAAWKRASGVVIRLPGKDDDSKLKAYHTILLIRCMGKVIEKVVAKLLSEDAKRRELLNDGLFGSRKRQLAIDAVAIMFDSAHQAWLQGNIVGVLLMDIKVAFPSVAKGRLVDTMKEKCMDGNQ